MRIVIPKDTLKRHRACSAAYTSPEWNESEQALVYSDWDATVARLLAMGSNGLEMIGWFVAHKLVPMTEDEFAAIKAANDAV